MLRSYMVTAVHKTSVKKDLSERHTDIVLGEKWFDKIMPPILDCIDAHERK